MTSLQQLPANDNKDVDIERLVDALEPIRKRVAARGDTFGACEATLLAVANEAVRRSLEKELQRRADDLPPEVRVDGVAYRRHQLGLGRYYSLCGELRVQRHTFREVGVRNGPTIVALDFVAGIFESSTPAFAYALTRGYAKAPIRIVEGELRAAHRVPPSLATLDRISRALGAAIRKNVEVVEVDIRKTEAVPEAAIAINLGLDRTTVPMEEAIEGWDRPHRGHRNITVRYRMAYIGTLTFTDASGEPLCTRRYAAPAHRGCKGILRRLVADIRRALVLRPELHIGVVQDNAPELWNVMRDALRGDPVILAKGWRETVDWYHLISHLARLLAVLVKKPAEREALLAEWRKKLQRSDRAVREIDAWLRTEGSKLPRRRREHFFRLSGMYMICEPHFRYASLKRYGLCAGSGVTEGACKSLIKMRAHRSGQRWTRDGIDAVLAVGSLVESERLESFWTRFERDHIARCA